jgi:hypothetical protein
VVQENDGASLERCRLTVRKRVRQERRIVATKRGGLLVEATDADGGKATKIPMAEVVATVASKPGITLADLGKALGVSKDTASNYVAEAEKAGKLVSVPIGPKREKHVYLPEVIAEPANTTELASSATVRRSGPADDEVTAERRTEPIGSAVGSSVVQGDHVSCSNYPAHQLHHFRDSAGWRCPICSTHGVPQ